MKFNNVGHVLELHSFKQIVTVFFFGGGGGREWEYNRISNPAGSIEADKCGEDKPTGFTLPVARAENDRVSPSEIEIEGGTNWKPNSGAVTFLVWGP